MRKDGAVELRATQRDEGAFLSPIVVRRLLLIVYARARRHLRGQSPVPGMDVADLVQEVWLVLLKDDCRQLRSWDPQRGASLETYVAMIADREFGNLRQRNAAQKRAGQTVDLESQHERVDSDLDPERVTIATRTFRDFRGYLRQRLPTLGVSVFDALYAEALDPDEITIRLGVRRQVVYNWKHRIRVLADEFSAPTEA